jgi:acetyl esterase
MSSNDTRSMPITDPEVLAFISRTDSFYPEDAVTRSIKDQRALYGPMAAAFRRPRPTGIDAEDDTVTGPGGELAIRTYRSAHTKSARVLYLHGGGFVVGGLESHDDVCAEISARCGIEVISLDYRLCPEHPHPAAYEDTLATIAHLAGKPIILAGDSAGANLVAAAALTRHPAIAGQVLIYPGLGGDFLELPSHTENADAPLLTTADVHAYHRMRLGGEEVAFEETAAPLLARDVSGLSPCFVSVAEVDPLRDDGLEWARRLKAAGVPAETSFEKQSPHAPLRARPTSTRAASAFDRIIAAISGMASG